ncbi:MAG TPA: ABC transporter ATP-binding protein [Acidimicrobiales bacterium]
MADPVPAPASSPAAGSATAAAVADDTLLSVRDLRAYFDTDDGVVKAVDGVSFDVRRGEVFAIVGESGSGKSVTAMTVLGLQPTVRIESGEILWKGTDLLTMPEDQRRRIRGNEIAMIFQDPLTALNPVHTVGRQIGEMARIHEGLSKSEAHKRAVEMLDLVGIPEPAKRAKMYPHEFSGGMRQRAMIAMAITCKPDLLIADEPTTALDVTVQAQVLEVLLDIKDEINSAIVLITHDLGVVAGLANRVMVMYAGRQVEAGTTDEIFYETRHPYTLGLLASLPRLDDSGDEPLLPIVGSPPSLIRVPPGCAFHPRCRFGRVPGLCDSEVPALRLVAGDAHLSACHYAEELAGVGVDDLRDRVVDVASEQELLGAVAAEQEAVGELAVGDDAPPAGETAAAAPGRAADVAVADVAVAEAPADAPAEAAPADAEAPAVAEGPADADRNADGSGADGGDGGGADGSAGDGDADGTAGGNGGATS